MRNATEIARVDCPYCNERIDVVVDYSAGSQEYIEDCAVCCRPMVLSVRLGERGGFDVSPRREDETH